MTVLFDQGDILPALVVTTAERVAPGDIYWGCARDEDGTSRNGYILEREGVPVPDGAIPESWERGGVKHVWVHVGSFRFPNPASLVLVQKR